MRHLLLLLALTCSIGSGWGDEPEIRLFNWSDYLPHEVLDRFTAETRIRVRYTSYDSNEAMYAKLKLLGGGGYDLAVPSTYYVDKMRKEGLLQAIDRARLPNFKHLDPRHLDKAFDPGNRYSVPYLWGTTGIVVNTAKVDPDEARRWADLWKPRFKNSLLLSNDMREVFHVALRVLGYSGNTTDRNQIREAYEKLIRLMPNVRIFNSDAADVLFVTGEVDAGMTWNGVAYRAQQEDPEIRYLFPEEGVILWMDNLVIPKNAEHVDLAHRLIDFLLRPDVSKLITERIGYASPNAAAIGLLDARVRNDPTVYPGDQIMARGEYQTDVGPAITVYAAYWEKLKAGE